MCKVPKSTEPTNNVESVKGKILLPSFTVNNKPQIRRFQQELTGNIPSVRESDYVQAGIMEPDTGFLLTDLLTGLVA